MDVLLKLIKFYNVLKLEKSLRDSLPFMMHGKKSSCMANWLELTHQKLDNCFKNNTIKFVLKLRFTYLIFFFWLTVFWHIFRTVSYTLEPNFRLYSFFLLITFTRNFNNCHIAECRKTIKYGSNANTTQVLWNNGIKYVTARGLCLHKWNKTTQHLVCTLFISV